MPPARRPRKGERRIDACLDHFAVMGYDARHVRAVVANLLKVYGGPDAWRFLEEGCYQVVQERLLEIEDEENLKQDHQQVPPEYHQQQDGQEMEDEWPPQVPDCLPHHRGIMIGCHARCQDLFQWSGKSSAFATWKDKKTLGQRFPPAPALATLSGGDVSSSASHSPSSDNIEHDISQATVHDVAQGTGAEHGSRRSTRERRASTRVHGSEWA